MPIAEALLCRASSLIALGFIFVPVLAAPMYLEAGIAEVFFFPSVLVFYDGSQEATRNHHF